MLEIIKHNADVSVDIVEIHSNSVELLDVMETTIVQAIRNVSMNNVLILVSTKVNVHQEQLAHHKIMLHFADARQV
jgi:hypothetical protein